MHVTMKAGLKVKRALNLVEKEIYQKSNIAFGIRSTGLLCQFCYF